MKSRLFVCMIFTIALAACGSPTAVATSTAMPAATSAAAQPTDTNAPVAATNTPAPAAETDTPASAAATDTPAPTVSGAVFSNPTRSGDTFSLRCSPADLTFGITSINPAISSVTIAYRMENKDKGNGLSPWFNGTQMVADGKGGFTFTFSAVKVSPDARVAHGWFDYQFVGLNKMGNVVGRSEIFVRQVTFTLDCP